MVHGKNVNGELLFEMDDRGWLNIKMIDEGDDDES